MKTEIKGFNFEDIKLKFNKHGLIPAIAQDFKTGEVLMLAYMNEESLKLTLERGKATYFSRSRQALWLKGETSGHFQHIKEIRFDCDCDTLLLLIEQEGAACHTGSYSCFYRKINLQEN
ncbi:MAG: phosphoribosyl-AMP cyclohydrolase [Clostridiales bacterium]|nr:phosphoribosyl-AMP cyclohydrolase [Clostridiales bacterium]